MTIWLATAFGAWSAQPKTPEDSVDFGVWWGVLIAFVVAPIVMYTVKFFADRRRDRMTKELVSESNKDGPVPDVPKDFEIPQVIPRKRGTGYGRWRRRAR
jgi:hypothetical protein